jgi:hypothetical protein
VDLFKANAHVFIIRFWLEPREMQDAQPEWRGVIQHVESGEHRYFRDLDVMVAFMAKHFEVLRKPETNDRTE